MKAILIGATGLVGGLLLQQLLQDATFTDIVSISRKPSGMKNPRLHERLIDFNDDIAFGNAVTAADVLFCCIGTTQKKVNGDKAAYRRIDFDIPVKAAAYCAALHMPAFVLVSALGANAGSFNFYLRLKGETEAAVAEKHLHAVYLMRPSFIMGNRKEHRPADAILQPVMQFFSMFFAGGLSKYNSIEARTVAAAMIAAAKIKKPGVSVCMYNEMLALVKK